LVPEGVWTGTLRLGVLVLWDPAFVTAVDCAVGTTVEVGRREGPLTGKVVSWGLGPELLTYGSELTAISTVGVGNAAEGGGGG
jgi:hypothetical protein